MMDWQDEMDTLIGPAIARSSTIEALLMAPGAIGEAGALHHRIFGAAPALLIADDNTYGAAGRAVEASLTAAGIATSTHILPGEPRPKPTVALGDQIAAAIAGAGAVPVAVGSGVINDLVKYAAFRQGQRYWCAATAASMDGYPSAGSPLSDQGFKKTIPCQPPLAILADLDIIAAAPARMSGWGYGDLAGKMPAGGDWIIADALGLEAIDDTAWPMVQDNLRRWLADPEAVARGAPDAVAALFSGLIVSGLAMEVHGSSRPASGADHQIAHIWEMESHVFNGERVSHGACVSIGAVTALGLFDWLLDRDLADLDIDRIVAAAPSLEAKDREIKATFKSPEVAARAMAETAAKHASPADHHARLHRLVAVWPDLRHRLRAHLATRADMAGLLGRAGAPVHASDIGIDPDHHRATIYAARFLRSRYTILDLLEETGLLQDAVAALFAQPCFQAA